ncbi:MAG: LamG-like jellyroll fold domain-containing protein [Saprospiraceae bacterium]
MYQKYSFQGLLTTLIIGFISITAYGQDTIWTKTLNFQSNARDTVISFPTEDHQYEKILMYYSMRCKKGLISTSSNRNLGCGEWDYSCNTSIIDSSATDSLKATHPNYIINGYGDSFFPYTHNPTYSAYEYKTKNIAIQSSTIESTLPLGNQNNPTFIGMNTSKPTKAYYIFDKSELGAVPSGNINGISILVDGSGVVDYFSCKVAKSLENIDSYENIEGLLFTEVINRSVTLNAGNVNVIFQKPFVYTANHHLILEISYFGNSSRLNNLSLAYNEVTNTPSITVQNDRYLTLGGQGVATLSTTSMKNIKKEISVSFWSRGNGLILPNNNSLFYATDSLGNRQLNAHLPWSNGRVFWDCGYANGGFDRIDKSALPNEYEDQWNHWVFTKNTNTGSMKMYLNGSLWHSGTGKTKELNIAHFFLGGSDSGGNLYNGDLDDFCVWDKELTGEEINHILYNSPSNEGSLFEHLMAHYTMDQVDETTLKDLSSYQAQATFSEKILSKRFSNIEIFKGYAQSKKRLQISLLKGIFSFTSQDATIRDSVENAPFKVTRYSVSNSNLLEEDTRYLWQAGIFPVYDEFGEIVDELEFIEDNIIIVEPLTYYRKFPAKFELLSFVTPYGIGLDFGLNGKTWVFDVSDYGPILKGNKRLLMDKGGERQEEIDIQFAFIKGTPPRQVLSIQQIWPADAYGYTAILSNQQLEARTIHVEPNVQSMKIRTVATGHGQEGEFIPRTHSLQVHNSNISWLLWKECADNPVYPQGGTWVYDRAGWCPGAPSDLREYEIMNMVGGVSSFNVDYGLNTAAGDSRYIVNTQLVKYGPALKMNDAAIEDIISPSPSAIHFRKNPICTNPEITLKNTGSNVLTKISVAYMVEGFSKRTFQWTGNLEFLNTTNIILPNLPGSELLDGGIFKVWIENVNDTADEYVNNNYLESTIDQTPFLKDGVIVSMRTNGVPHETSWILKDESGTIIKRSRNNMTANTMYNDTIRNLSGCFTLQFLDSDDDGISWWANGDGNGIIRAKGVGEDAFRIFQPDFGREYTFQFVSGDIVSVEDEKHVQKFNIRPNPVVDELWIDLKGHWPSGKIYIFNNEGMELMVQEINNSTYKEGSISISVSGLPEGMYFVKCMDEKQSQIRKFIKIN